MKLATFCRDGSTLREIGVVLDDDRIAVLDPAIDPAFGSMLALIDAGKPGLDRVRAVCDTSPQLALSGVRLLAPLPEPRQMRDALCFEQHLRQARANVHLFGRAPGPVKPEDVDVPQVWYDQPVYYKCNRFSISGPGAEIRWPRGETRLDFELEMAMVIAKKGRDITHDTADAHIFGFTIFNDFSARDIQFRETLAGLGPAKGKDFDTGNSLGPWIVTLDEIGDYQNLGMRARVNGKPVADGSTRQMHHTFKDVLVHISRDETLYPGEVICSGTVGNGCGLERAEFLAPGDRVELEIDAIGILGNTVGNRR